MRLFIHIILLFLISGAVAQDLELANEYFQKEEYQKAKIHYEVALKKRVPLIEVYPKYPKTLVQTGDVSEADRFYKKLIKTGTGGWNIKMDYLIFLKNIKSKEFEKTLVKTQKEALEENNSYQSMLYYLNTIGEYELAESFIQAYRKYQGSKTSFYKELAEIKKLQGKNKEMVEQLLIGLMEEEEETENLKNMLQNYLSDREDLEHFKTLLIDVSQKEPDNTTSSELLLWIFIQLRDFESAGIHARALDKRTRSQGEKQKEVADLALENRNYDAAITIYLNIIKDNPRSSAAVFAKGKYLSAREQKIKTRFPADKTELQLLVKDYKNLIQETTLTGSTNSYKYKADMALLYGFYLQKLDSAILILNEALLQSQFDKKFQAQGRLNLGDLYLLDNQPWESTLLYSQVEALEKDQLLGHEAKLKNARLHYYQGDFQLAQEQMDVLKLATSREISNDAIQLSVLIQDNISEDTTGYALKKFSGIELLIFQNKWEEAKNELASLYTEYRANSLKDDILMLQAKIAKQFGEYDKAIERLNTLIENHREDILADDAAFLIAQLYDYSIRNQEKAMEFYNKIITQYPSSIFVVESRKRYRELRGDKVN